jgi:hypothetical protein
MCAISSSTPAAGCSILWIAAAATSRRLCAGISVAMPTAIPEAPLSSRKGRRAGRKAGSSKEPS